MTAGLGKTKYWTVVAREVTLRRGAGVDDDDGWIGGWVLIAPVVAPLRFTTAEGEALVGDVSDKSNQLKSDDVGVGALLDTEALVEPNH